jgi:hypothetical protein
MDNLERTVQETIYHERHNIIEQCHRRMKLGEINYGDRDVCISEVNFLARDIFRDYEEETLDRINYAKMLIVEVHYNSMKSKPSVWKEFIDREMQEIDEEMMRYAPPDGELDYDELLYQLIDRDINQLISLRLKRSMEGQCEKESI